jgi:ubiquinone/menaquinone biosynthesis C-methylase UbiE
MLVAMGSPGADAGRRERDVGSFDRRARRYDQDWRAEFHRIVVTRSAQVALSVAPDPASVLDIGCGTGSLLRMLAERLPGATSLVGVDPAPTMIEVGAGRLGDPRVRLAMAVAERLPLEDASFDLVVSTVSFDHWADQPAGLAEVARVLRPAGRLVLVDLFATGWLRAAAALGRRRDRMRTAGELHGMLAAARLHPLAWRHVYDLGPLPLVQAVIAEPGRRDGGG